MSPWNDDKAFFMTTFLLSVCSKSGKHVVLWQWHWWLLYHLHYIIITLGSLYNVAVQHDRTARCLQMQNKCPILYSKYTYSRASFDELQWTPVPLSHDDVIKCKHFPRYWSFVRGIHRSPVNSPHTGQWRGALVFFSICAWINGWVNSGEAGDLRCHRAHYDVTVMS